MNLGQYFKMRDQCQIAADAGMVKYRAAPGAQNGLNCWAYLANKTPADPATLFLEHDLRAAMEASNVYYMTRARMLDSIKEEVKPALTGPNAAQIDERFTGCAAKVRPAVRAIAYGTAPKGISSNSRLADAITADLAAGLAGPARQYAPLMNPGDWPVSAALWGRLAASGEIGDAIICTRGHQLRTGRPEGAMAPIDIATRMLTDTGASPVEAVVVVTAALLHPAGYQSVGGLDRACAAWGVAVAKKYGAAYYEGQALRL